MKEAAGQKKAVINYPCPWSYRVIGADEEELRRAVAEIVQDRSYRMVLSRSSANGKYQSFCVEMIVESEGHRIALYQALRNHEAVKIVL
ncbi:MAG TPA: DUF493 domain-containing protein [Syntrophales bacterium]|mgnify:CR=1 FL=1|jgi:hypothetical protein|nr:DUF493 domain-containing protein [Syntrophales bacterium]HQG34529.1 DUF493 domain-containing protein [Syntrophales bacterium]HQI36145.1 DUF493 domain-containing protein [Syntrophales bacterium]HRR47863.1 DUF493 domain-containing protein [Syntrophales bacterium]HRU89215.1 DUF493 domain-containing protein [Syntrophales bacterium]